LYKEWPCESCEGQGLLRIPLEGGVLGVGVLGVGVLEGGAMVAVEGAGTTKTVSSTVVVQSIQHALSLTGRVKLLKD
jgi:hypothetical protein